MYEPSYGTHVFLSPSLLVSLSPRLVAPRSTSRSPSLESKNKARIKMPFLVKFQCLFIGEEWKSFEGEIWRWVGEVKHNRFESSGVAQMMMMVMMLPFEEILSKAGWESWASSEMRFLKALDICLQLPANTIQSPSFSCVQIDWVYVWVDVKLANSCGCAIHLSKWAIHLLIMATCLWVIRMIAMVLSGRARWWLEWWPRADADARCPSIHSCCWSAVSSGHPLPHTIDNAQVDILLYAQPYDFKTSELSVSQTLLNPLRRIWSGSAFVNNPASGATPLAAQDNGH